MNSGSSGKRHTAAGTSRVQAPLDRCAAPGPAAARRFRDDRAPHLMLRALPTWFQEPRVPDARWNPNLLPATRCEPRREPHREPPLQLVRQSPTAPPRSPRPAAAPATPQRTSTLTLTP